MPVVSGFVYNQVLGRWLLAIHAPNVVISTAEKINILNQLCIHSLVTQTVTAVF